MIDEEHKNKYIRVAQIVASYLATISLLLLVQYLRAPKWKLFINHTGRYSALLIVAMASSLFLLSVNRRKISSFFRSEVVQYSILVLAIILGLYLRFPMLDLIVFLYTVYAILFIRSSLETNRLYKPTRRLVNNILDALLDVESRSPALFALLLLILIPFLMILNKKPAAESVAVYVYYLLAITVILQLLEVKQGIEKENRLFTLLTDGCGTVYRTLTDNERRSLMCDSVRMLARKVFKKQNMVHAAILLVMLAGVYVAKNSYWKRVMHEVNSNAEFRSELALNGNDSGSYTFPSYTDEITVPIKVKHPLSNPLWWTESGDNAVRIKIVWFTGNDSKEKQVKVFEDYQTIPRALFIDDYSDIQLSLHRPMVPADRNYEVQIGLVFVNNNSFLVSSDSILKLRVHMERLSGNKAITHERALQVLMQEKVEEQWSDQLWSSQRNYRSKIEIIEGNFLTPMTTYTIAVTNRGSLSWPAHNKHAVKIGVVWMRKIADDGNDRFIQLAEDTYSLPDVVLPGKTAVVQVSVKPMKEPDADEIWIGLIHEGKTWFYSKGDAVLKLPNKDKQPMAQLIDLEKKNVQLENELMKLRVQKNHSLKMNAGKSLPDEVDYGSRIRLVHDLSKDRVMAFADRLLLDLEITNTGNEPWIPSNELPVNLGVLWFNTSGKAPLGSVRDAEERCTFPLNVLKDVTIRMQCAIGAKVLPGNYEVWISPVHEGTAWFYEKGDSVLKLNVTVR